VYPGPKSNLRGPPEGDFVPGNGLEAWPTDSLVAHPSLMLWRFAPDRQNWQNKVPLPNSTFSDLPAVLASHEAVFAKAPASADLEAPDPALSVRFYHQDHLGSSSVMTDGVGGLVEESGNYPFGSLRSEFRPRGLVENYQFTQKERDGESGITYLEVRFLATHLGRFTRIDPLALSIQQGWLGTPQMLNIYSYCVNRPMGYIDPSGMVPTKVMDYDTVQKEFEGEGQLKKQLMYYGAVTATRLCTRDWVAMSEAKLIGTKFQGWGPEARGAMDRFLDTRWRDPVTGKRVYNFDLRKMIKDSDLMNPILAGMKDANHTGKSSFGINQKQVINSDWRNAIGGFIMKFEPASRDGKQGVLFSVSDPYDWDPFDPSKPSSKLNDLRVSDVYHQIGKRMQENGSAAVYINQGSVFYSLDELNQ